jgi:5-methylthioribose kinase
MDATSILDYVLNNTTLRRLVLSDGDDASQPPPLSVKEVGDGNINFVFVVSGNGGCIVLKQALPFVRCVGESWPLTQQRATFEVNALVEQRRLCPELVPIVYHFDASKALIGMQFIAPPNMILRRALMAGHRYPHFAQHLGTFLAKTLFGTSLLALDGVTLRAKVAEWSANSAMCALTEKVIFDDPYIECRHNRWTSPQLDAFSGLIRSSTELKVAAALLKGKFLSCTQALLHGDLHTGSVMASEKTTYVIDPEFAFYGPMGFDVGALLSNLLLSYFSQAATNGADYAEWVLEQTVILHQTFAAGFLELWSESLRQAEASVAGAGGGEHFKAAVFDTARSVERAQAAFMQNLWYDSLGFAGVKMIRRIVGLAHVADLEDIHDADKRSDCEKRALLLGTELVLLSQSQQGLSCVLQLADRARQVYAGSTPQSLV